MIKARILATLSQVSGLTPEALAAREMDCTAKELGRGLPVAVVFGCALKGEQYAAC